MGVKVRTAPASSRETTKACKDYGWMDADKYIEYPRSIYMGDRNELIAGANAGKQRKSV